MSRFVIAFLPRSKGLLISWFLSPSVVILEPRKIKFLTVSIVSPSFCHEVMGTDAMTLVFWMLNYNVKVLHSIHQQIWKTQQWTQDWKRSGFILNSKKGNAKECSNYRTVVLSHASKVMLKILQVRLQQYMNQELPDVQVGFRKGRGTRDQIANICWIIKKQESSTKTSISALLTMPKPLTVWIITDRGKLWKRWEY